MITCSYCGIVKDRSNPKLKSHGMCASCSNLFLLIEKAALKYAAAKHDYDLMQTAKMVDYVGVRRAYLRAKNEYRLVSDEILSDESIPNYFRRRASQIIAQLSA